MENVNRWYYSKELLANTPSRKCDIDQPKELSYRQQAANFIQDMGQRLQLSQLCINTAIVYMHRFYVYHSFTEVHRNNLSISALFLAAKVEEQPRKLEHVIKVAHVCLHKDSPALDVRSEAYSEKAQEVVFHENILLQTLGFVLAIEHPHTYVVKVCQLVKASKDLAQSSYLMATTSLHMTTMCIQYKPTVVACVCIHLACKWSSYLIEPCSEGREWFYYVDRTVTLELLEKLTQDFIAILETSPHRFKKKFGKETVGYHNPKAIIENAAKEAKEASASEKKNGISINKEEPSPGPSSSSSLSFDFCPHFDDKLVKYDKGPDYEHNNNRAPELPGVKKPPVMTVSRKVPEARPEPKKFAEVDIAKKIQQDMESKKALMEVDSNKGLLDIDIGKKIQQDMDRSKKFADMGVSRKVHDGDVSKKPVSVDGRKSHSLADRIHADANRKAHVDNSKKSHMDVDRKSHAMESARKSHAYEVDRKPPVMSADMKLPHGIEVDRKPRPMELDNVYDLPSYLDPLEFNRKSHAMELDRKPHVAELDRKPHVAELDRKPHVSEIDRKPHVSEIDRKPHFSEIDRKPHVAEIDRKPHITEIDRKPYVPEVDRKPNVMEVDKRLHAMEQDGKFHAKDVDRKHHSIEADRKPHTINAERKPYAMDVDRKPHVSDGERKPHLDAQFQGDKLQADRKVHALVADNKANAVKIQSKDYVTDRKPPVVEDVKKQQPVPAVKSLPSHMDPTVRIKIEPGIELGLLPMSSDKRNGLSPIKSPSPVPTYDFPPVKVEPVVNNDAHVSSKRSSEHRHREKHKSKHSSRDRHNHSGDNPPASIKVKIRKDIIPSLVKGALKTDQPESPKPSLKIKLPKPPGMVTPEPPPKLAKPSLPKLVITKDKSGSGSYSTSHKNESSRKRSHSSAEHKNSHTNNETPPSKYVKVNHSSHKSSRHRESKTTFQPMPNYPNYAALPPPPLPNFVGGYVMNNMQLQPPLPPERPHLPQPPPPLPPPE